MLEYIVKKTIEIGVYLIRVLLEYLGTLVAFIFILVMFSPVIFLIYLVGKVIMKAYSLN
jgi:uncharacterized membrane protein YgaE (UPF0421/DUF939 family)